MKLSFFTYIKNLFKRNEGYSKEYSKIIFVESFSSIPADTGDDIYVVRNANNYKWAVFMCPNNCGHRVEVNLMKARYPRWRLTIKKKKASLYPSIVVKNCGAHFWLVENGVLWSHDDLDEE